MMEIAIYGLPVRMPHWSFGVRYIYQLIQRRMGHSRLFEVMFPGNPGHAYLAQSNALAENMLVTAHVLGHADFSQNNQLFRAARSRWASTSSSTPRRTRTRSQQAIETYGAERVEHVLDAALALEPHVDVDQALHRARYPEYLAEPKPLVDDAFRKRFASLDPADTRRRAGAAQARADAAASRARPAVVHRELRAGARELGARHLSGRARRIVLLLSRCSPARS